MTRFWTRFTQPTEDHRPLTYPPNKAILGWWCSGYDSDDNAILCALISAESEDAAWNAVIQDWPEAIGPFHFCDEVSDDWRPSDRFVIAGWSKERIDA